VVKPRVCVLRVAGTNCDYETAWAFAAAGAVPERVHLNLIISGARRLTDFQILVIPGGFSYGDDIAAGRVLANELRYKIRDQISEFLSRKRPVLGICNGFQVLVKSGILPFGSGQKVTLGWNDSGRFEDRWVFLRTEETVCPFVRGLAPVIRMPVAHAEGKFIAPVRVRRRLAEKGQVVFRYAAASGGPASYPDNPNGSEDDIAGICDSTGLVFGLMPHPERAALREHDPYWLRCGHDDQPPAGAQIFRNVVEYVS